LAEDYAVALEIEPSSQVEEAIHDGLRSFNRAFVEPYPRERFAVTLRAAGETIVGGLVGSVNCQWLFIDWLWVRTDLRSRGFGSAILARAEDEARRLECTGVCLDTMDWQARPFYERHGYTAFGELADAPARHTRYFMKKRL
jgi:GNAT superfamily N-acetyltransferase